MDNISMDRSSGFVPEDELLQITELPGAGAADATPDGTPAIISAISGVVSALSAAFGDGCPTTVCTSRC